MPSDISNEFQRYLSNLVAFKQLQTQKADREIQLQDRTRRQGFEDEERQFTRDERARAAGERATAAGQRKQFLSTLGGGQFSPQPNLPIAPGRTGFDIGQPGFDPIQGAQQATLRDPFTAQKLFGQGFVGEQFTPPPAPEAFERKFIGTPSTGIVGTTEAGGVEELVPTPEPRPGTAPRLYPYVNEQGQTVYGTPEEARGKPVGTKPRSEAEQDFESLFPQVGDGTITPSLGTGADPEESAYQAWLASEDGATDTPANKALFEKNKEAIMAEYAQ